MTVTLKLVVALFPHWSVAVTWTVVVPNGKHVVSGGLKVSVGWAAQQVSTAMALNGTKVQSLQVYAVILVA
jgi:hypothetical protein